MSLKSFCLFSILTMCLCKYTSWFKPTNSTEDRVHAQSLLADEEANIKNDWFFTKSSMLPPLVWEQRGAILYLNWGYFDKYIKARRCVIQVSDKAKFRPVPSATETR